MEDIYVSRESIQNFMDELYEIKFERLLKKCNQLGDIRLDDEKEKKYIESREKEIERLEKISNLSNGKKRFLLKSRRVLENRKSKF